MKNKAMGLIAGWLIVLTLVLSACGTPAATTQVPATSTPAATTQGLTSNVSATPTIFPATTSTEAKPQGELIAALPSFGDENYLPWQADAYSSQLCCIVYDVLLYYDEVNLKFIPGLAESWEVSADALTLTYHLRKGVQFQDGWGELTAADVKYNFEMQASPFSSGKATQTRRIASMDTPDDYTLVIHFKDPYPTFFMEFSLGNGGVCQGIASKKYVETVGEDTASQKPIGTGPYRMIDSNLATSYKFEALDSHWRVVPEFKYLTVLNVPEMSTIIAMLKTREIDLANVTAEQMSSLKAAGVATEVSQVGGSIFNIAWGGVIIPADPRYDPSIHNKDPWKDPRVRKAMTISIDREAICKAIFAGGADPAAVPLFTSDMDKYQYPYDPAAARQLLKEAGYPDGFSFKVVSFAIRGAPEAPRIMEALAGYWQQIGLNPKITVSEQPAYVNLRMQLKTAGEVSPQGISPGADMLEKISMFMMPGGLIPIFQDEGSYAIYKEISATVNSEERAAYVQKLNKYFYENYGPIPIVRICYCFAWNSDKISPFPHTATPAPYYLEYVRHAQPLNTFRLFNPMAGR